MWFLNFLIKNNPRQVDMLFKINQSITTIFETFNHKNKNQNKKIYFILQSVFSIIFLIIDNNNQNRYLSRSVKNYNVTKQWHLFSR